MGLSTVTPLLILLCALVFLFSPYNTVAQSSSPYPGPPYNQPNFTFSYDEIGFLRTPIKAELCLAIPNVAEMKIIKPDDFLPNRITNETCDQNEWGRHVTQSILGSLIFVILALFAGFCVCPCICIARHALQLFGGSRPSTVEPPLKGTLLPGEEDISGYSLKEVQIVKFSVVCLFIIVMVGVGIVIVGTQLVTTFNYQAQTIFLSYGDYNIETVQQTGNQLIAIPAYNNAEFVALVAEANQIASDFREDAADNIADMLANLGRGVQALLYFTMSVTFLLILLGVAAIVWKLPRLSLFLAFFITFLVALVWIDFSLVYGASNIFNKMCETINECHFCYEGQYPGNCSYDNCNHPWFITMSSCSNKAANRYENLTNAIVDAYDGVGVSICGMIHELCSNDTKVKCFYLNGNCTADNLRIYGDNIVTITVESVDNETTVYTLSDVGNATGHEELASTILGELSNVSSAYDALMLLTTLNCNANNAYVETNSGTFAQLQEHLCPETTTPEYSIFEILKLIAIGCMIIGILLPCIQIGLCLGAKRFADGAVKHGAVNDYNEERTGLINSTKDHNMWN